MRFLLPTGIGDSVWALHKVQAIAAAHGDNRIDISLSCGKRDEIQNRALDFVRRFSFVDSAEMRPGYDLLRDPAFTPDGYWNYIEDGFYEFGADRERFCVLIPNAALERGERLESWLPHHTINWDVMDDFRIRRSEREFAEDVERRVGSYAVFYPGPLDGNTVQGHNRGMLWRPGDWLRLAERIHRKFGLAIVAVGAPYDASYYDALLAPSLNGASRYWHSLIGTTSIGELFATTSRARFCVSYQAGVGIVATLLGTPTAIFWRAHGDSLCRDGFLSFDEGMASGWVPPGRLAAGTHLPLIYGRHGVDDIMAAATNRGWAK